MDLFGIKGLKEKLMEAESENRRLKFEISNLEYKKHELERQLKGERVSGGYCAGCKNSYPQNLTIPPYNAYGCILDCKCKDFDRKDKPDC